MIKKWFVKRRVITERWIIVEAETREEAKALACNKIEIGDCNSNRDEITIAATPTY